MTTYILIGLTLIVVVLLALIFSRQQESVIRLESRLESLEKGQERTERGLRDEIAKNREELGKNISELTRSNEEKLEKIRGVVESQLKFLQEDNNIKLERIRETVDEKLQSTLDRRLGDSFKLVSERLEKVHQGLGEMQGLAAGVGDLKRVLTNVKTRGTFGELQLEILLEQILTPEQYEKNIPTKKGSRDPVEFAVKLPGHDQEPVYLPIDAKFPSEDYQRLQNAQEAGQAEAVEQAGRALETRVKAEAKNIRYKYLDPPYTTDFGILFLSTEGLYAEILRRPGLSEILRRDYRVIITGPTTCAALLNSLQMGFRTLAVERRAGEVWNLLGTVKTEFGKFGEILEKTNEKLKQASKTIEDAASKSRTIERKLRHVQELPVDSPNDALPLAEESKDLTDFAGESREGHRE